MCPARCLSHRQATIHIEVLPLVLTLLEFRESGFQPSLSSSNPGSVLKLIDRLLSFPWTTFPAPIVFASTEIHEVTPSVCTY